MLGREEAKVAQMCGRVGRKGEDCNDHDQREGLAGREQGWRQKWQCVCVCGGGLFSRFKLRRWLSCGSVLQKTPKNVAYDHLLLFSRVRSRRGGGWEILSDWCYALLMCASEFHCVIRDNSPPFQGRVMTCSDFVGLPSQAKSVGFWNNIWKIILKRSF